MNLTKVTTMRLAAGCAAVTLLLIPAPAQSLGSVLKDGVLAPRKQAPPQAPPAARPSAPQRSTPRHTSPPVHQGGETAGRKRCARFRCEPGFP